jgi:protein gp37
MKTANWNPWHGCKKISEGCRYCYVYRQDSRYNPEIQSSEVRKTSSFELPLKRKRDKSFKLESETLVFTCFTSDFFVDDADDWRKEAWKIIKERSDLIFYIFTKRIDRFNVSLPPDWGDGYENVIIGCTIENQQRANYRIPIFRKLPIRHKTIICAPLLERIDLRDYLDPTIEEVAASGESGNEARVCDYEWVLDIGEQCLEADIPFCFHQTGARFLKNGKLYRINRKFQISQAKKAGIDYRINHPG